MLKHDKTKLIVLLTAISCLIAVASSSTALAAVPVKPPAGSSNGITIDTILAQVEERFEDIYDLSGLVDLKQYTSDGTVVAAQTTVDALLPGLLRLEFVNPETFAGAIYVIDRDKDQVIQYSPITEQAIVSSIDQVIAERFVPTTVEQLFSLPSPDDYDLTLVGTQQSLLHVSARPKKADDTFSYHFWIDKEQWMVQRMQVFDAGALLFEIMLSGIVTNSGFSATQLRSMPAGAIMIYR
jgi:outer membrane lipoprotein-sorting protein